MTLETFKAGTMGGSYGNPKTNTFVGQCVSYFRKYCEDVLNIPTYPAGDALAYWDNEFSQQHFDKVSTPQQGDVVVYGAVPHNPYGHIGIYYNGMLLSQNLDIQLHVSVASLNLAGNKLGYLRLKGELMEPIATPDQIDSYSVKLFSYPDKPKRHATQAEIDNFVKQKYTLWQVWTAWSDSNERLQLEAYLDQLQRDANTEYVPVGNLYVKKG